MERLITAFLLLGLSLSTGLSQEPLEADPSEMPRIPATEPADALATFEVSPGFRLELAAHEPLVEDPIDIAFDEQGRMFVVEMRGYSEHREEGLGRIRLLVDEDDDGIFDSATIYADGLKWPTSVCCYDGGVFVTASPDIFYFKDTDGDGRSDLSETVFTGFGQGLDRLNMQALVNSLTWGPDNRIWGATARNGGNVRRPDQPESEAISLRGADFSFDPKTRDLRAENGTAQFGLSFDSSGRRFVCSNSNHLQWVAWERDWMEPNPYFSMPSPLVSIASDGAAAPVFRISPDEPWRIVRTRWRVSGVVKGAVEGGGRVSGYFTAATGVTIYTGDAYDRVESLGEADPFRGSAFIGDAGSNLVHRKVLHQVGAISGGISRTRLQPLAQRGSSESKSEFVASRDNWFRPVNFENGPDGCLYICDMYRETIEHPWSIPDGIKKYVDLDSGRDRGRIYRVVQEEHTRRPRPNLAELSDDELAALCSPSQQNGWHRTTARRLLYERDQWQDDDAIGDEEQRLLEASTPLGRFRHTLSLSRSDDPGKIEELAELSRQAGNDQWQLAAIAAAVKTPEEAVALLAANPWFELKPMIAEMLGRMNNPPAIEQFLANSKVLLSVEKIDPVELLKQLTALAAGLERNGNSLASIPSAEEHLTPFLVEAIRLIENGAGRTDIRQAGINFLGICPDADGLAAQRLRELFVNVDESEAIRKSALESLIRRSASDLPGYVAANWKILTPAMRGSAFAFLASKANRIAPLLDSFESGSLAADLITPDQASALRSHRDGQVKARAVALFPPPAKGISRESIVERYQAALKLSGDPKRGKAAFIKGTCITCHKTPDGLGMAVGPDLATFKTAGADSILKNLFDPNAEVAPQYQTFAFDFLNGETASGIIAREDATEVTIRMPGGLEKTFARKDVAGMKGLGRSLMPEGLEAALSEQEVADLLAYIATAP